MSSTIPVPQLNQLTRMMFPGAQDLVNNRQCPLCREKIDPNKFTDGRSLHEYTISGICQPCQDKAFGDGSE